MQCCGTTRKGPKFGDRKKRKKEWADSHSSLSLKKRHIPARGPAVDRPRENADANKDAQDPKFDIAAHAPKWHSIDRWEIDYSKRLGEGGYGYCYLARDKRTNAVVVAKQMKVSQDPKKKAKSEQMITRECYMLKLVQDGPDIVQLIDTCKLADGETAVLIFEYIDSPPYKDTYTKFALNRKGAYEARKYLYHVLKAIDYTHSKGIIHRDIKGGNTLYNPVNKKVRLIDWGFADFYREEGYDQFPGTRYYKAPEMFLKYRFYGYAADMWSFGAMAASMITQQLPLFAGESDDPMAQMFAIGSVLGMQDYASFLARYSDSIPEAQKEIFSVEALTDRGCPQLRVPVNHLADPVKARYIVNHNALGFIDRLLQWDPNRRMTSAEALKHPYFGRLRYQRFHAHPHDHEFEIDDEDSDAASLNSAGGASSSPSGGYSDSGSVGHAGSHARSGARASHAHGTNARSGDDDVVEESSPSSSY